MGIMTLARYLVGQADAIQQVARQRRAIWLGLLFVLTAGFAREYDGEDLLSEPWHLLLPLAASLVTATLLFGLLWVVLHGWRTISNTGAAYRSFLGLYWLTAPLAWLYALPVERFLSAADATRFNLGLLGLVALWRVLLMVRVVSVVFRLPVWQSFFVVMLFADSVALGLLQLTPLPVVSMMGGVRLTESEQVLQSVSMSITVLGMLSWPVWFLGTLLALSLNYRREPYQADAVEGRVAPAAWALAAAALLVWVPILPLTQPEQQRRHAVERELRKGNIAQALATMSRYERRHFPPHWDPPPRIGYGEREPSMKEVMEVLLSTQTRQWVADLYHEKFHSHIDQGYESFGFWHSLSDEDFDRYLTILERLPADTPLIEDTKVALTEESQAAHRTPEQRARIHALLSQAAEKEAELAAE